MSDISVNHFNRYDINPINVGGRFSPDEVTANGEAFTKTFLNADTKVQREILKQLTPEAKQKLFEVVKQKYMLEARKENGDIRTLDSCISALILTSASIIGNMHPCGDYKELSVNVMKFMHKNIKYFASLNEYQENPQRAEQRLQHHLDGGQVLAEGNYNGCGEAVKLFECLYSEATSQNKGFRNVECNYISSFNKAWATPENLKSGESPPGHAMAELSQNENGKPILLFLLDTSMFEDPVFDNRIVQFNELESMAFIKHPNNNGEYDKDVGKGPEPFALFGRGIKYDLMRNPHDPYDCSTSDGATRIAVRNYINSKK